MIPKVGDAVALLEELVDVAELITDDELFDVVEEALEVDEVETTEEELCNEEEAVGVVVEEVVEVKTLDVLDVLEELDFVLELEVDGTTLLLLLGSRDLSSYISSLLPAPQYSYGLPGHVKEQSVKGARTDPAFITLPQ